LIVSSMSKTFSCKYWLNIFIETKISCQITISTEVSNSQVHLPKNEHHLLQLISRNLHQSLQRWSYPWSLVPYRLHTLRSTLTTSVIERFENHLWNIIIQNCPPFSRTCKQYI
jgi:hypothetical protein